MTRLAPRTRPARAFRPRLPSPSVVPLRGFFDDNRQRHLCSRKRNREYDCGQHERRQYQCRDFDMHVGAAVGGAESASCPEDSHKVKRLDDFEAELDCRWRRKFIVHITCGELLDRQWSSTEQQLSCKPSEVLQFKIEFCQPCGTYENF